MNFPENGLNLRLEFFKFIYKRQLIWYKRFRLSQPFPWTIDPILTKYKILNVYRELDKGTLYIIDKLNYIKNHESLFINILFYRFFNKFGLYENLNITPFERFDLVLKNQLNKKFKMEKNRGKAIFNDAYLIGGNKTNEPKYSYILNILSKIDNSLITKIKNSSSPHNSLKLIQEIQNVGPFLAYEIWTDLTYFDFFAQKWTDNDFVNIGPGAKWGLEIIAKGNLRKNEQLNMLNLLHKEQEAVLPRINKSINEELAWNTISYKKAYSNIPFLSLRNIEHSLCEFRKYWNIKNNKGKRRLFKHGKR